MAAHFTTYNQPDGFEALEAETHDFTEVVLAHSAPAVSVGDKLVIYNTPLRHLAAVVSVIGDAYKRDGGEDVERWPFAVRVEPHLVSDRGPRFTDVPAGRANPRSISDDFLRRCETIVRLNRRRPRA